MTKKHYLLTFLAGVLLFPLFLFSANAGGGKLYEKQPEPKPESLLSKGITPITGTFIQPWLYMNFTPERWEKELDFWEELGVEYIIMGDTLTCSATPINDPSKWVVTAYYDTKNPSFNKGKDYLSLIFQKCSERGIKVFSGIGNTLDNWPYLGPSAPGFDNVCTLFAEVAEDLYSSYYEKYPETFAGFYFVPELFNSSAFDTEVARGKYVTKIASGFNIIFETINRVDSSLPFILSPYVNMFGGDWVSKSPQNISLFWKELLAESGFRDGDILCPQDSMGAGGADLTLLGEVTAAYRAAVDGCGKEIKLWSNCEIFEQPTGKFYDNYDGYGYWGSATIDRMTSQFQVVAPYVERIFAFAAPHYLSPNNTVDGYYDSYKFYLEHGILDPSPPTPPTEFRTIYQFVSGKKTLCVCFSGMYDNLGIHKVNIYKDGELFTYRLATRNDSGSVGEIYPNNFIDLDYDPQTNESVTYEFEVIDCSGNKSGRVSFTVEPGSVPNNIRLSPFYNGPTENKPFYPGDIDGDFKLTSSDLAKVKLHILGLDAMDEDGVKSADMDSNGAVNITDYIALWREVKKSDKTYQ